MDWLTGLITGGLGLFGNIFDMFGQQSANEDNINASWNMMKAQQDFNRQMYNLQYWDTKELMGLQQGYNKDLMSLQSALSQAQQDWLYKNYNSPSALAKSMRQGGINPSALFSQGQGFSGMSSMGQPSLPSTPSASAPSALSLSPMLLQKQNTMHSFSNMLRDIGTSVEHFAKAEREGVLTDKDKATFSFQVDYAKFQAAKMQTDASMADLQFALEQAFGSKDRQAALDEKIANIQMKISQGKYLESQVEINRVRKDLLSFENYKNESFKPFVVRYFDALVTNMEIEGRAKQQSIKTMRAQESALFSSAQLNNALAKTENELRSGKANLLNIQYSLGLASKVAADEQNQFNAETHAERVIGTLDKMASYGLINEKHVQELKNLKKQGDWIDRNNFINYVRQAAGAIGDVTNAFSNLRGTELRNLRQSDRNAIYDRFEKAWEDSKSKPLQFDDDDLRSRYFEDESFRNYVNGY